MRQAARAGPQSGSPEVFRNQCPVDDTARELGEAARPCVRKSRATSMGQRDTFQTEQTFQGGENEDVGLVDSRAGRGVGPLAKRRVVGFDRP